MEGNKDESKKQFLSQYTIGEIIGRGENSTVHKVRHQLTGQYAALKVFDRKLFPNEVSMRFLKNEISILRSLKSEFVPQLYNVFQDKSNYYILQELCDQGELFTALKREQKFDVSKIRDYGLQIAKAIEYIHSQNIIHRDVKLGNIALKTPGRIVKLLDYGLAIRLDKPFFKDSNNPMGTPQYIAPEVLTDCLYSKAVDVWALGVILYNLAVGIGPFEVVPSLKQSKDNPNSIKHILNAVRSKEVVFPADMHPPLADLIRKCLNRNHLERIAIKEVIEHDFFLDPTKRRPLMPNSIGSKFGSMFSSQKIKRATSQNTTQTTTSSLKTVHGISAMLSKGRSVDKSKIDTSTDFEYNSLLKDLSRVSMGDDKPRLINTAGVSPISYTIKNGKISVLKNGCVEVDMSLKKQKIIRIAGDGNVITVTSLTDNSKKTFLFKDMPLKYVPVYTYAYKVLNLIKSTIPKTKFENPNGRFYLMMNEPFPNYEAYFSNSLVIKHTVSSGDLKLIWPQGERIIKLRGPDIENLEPELREQVNTALKYLDFFLEGDTEQPLKKPLASKA